MSRDFENESESNDSERTVDYTPGTFGYASITLGRDDHEPTYTVDSYPNDPNAQVQVDFNLDFGSVALCLNSDEAAELRDAIDNAIPEDNE